MAAIAAMATTATPLVLIGLLALPATGQAQSTLPQLESLRLRWSPDDHLTQPPVARALGQPPLPFLSATPPRRPTRQVLGLHLRFNQGLTRLSLTPRAQGVRLRFSHDF